MTNPTNTDGLRQQAAIYRYVGLAMIAVTVVMLIAHVTSFVAFAPVILIALVCIVMGLVTRSKMTG